jgi:hypothetical protein
VSLIDEALKRARQEAAQQDAARRGPAPSWTPVPLAPLRERRSPLPLAVALAVALLLAIGLVWSTRRTPAPPSAVGTVAAAPAERAVAQPAAPAVQSTVQPAAPAPRDRAAPATREDDASRQAARTAPREGGDVADRSDRADRSERSDRGQAAPEPRTARAEPGREMASRREPAPPASPAPTTAAAEPPASRARAAEARPAAPAAAATVAPEDGRSYVREASLPGGRKLELRGIAFSDTQPVVLINGKVLSPGEGVEGYTVVSIQPQRVELKGASGTLYLTLQ